MESGRPLVLVMAGPAGLGKTELATTLGEAMLGRFVRCIQLPVHYMYIQFLHVYVHVDRKKRIYNRAGAPTESLGFLKFFLLFNNNNVSTSSYGIELTALI